MNWDQVEGQWKDMKGKIRQKWGKFTDDDFEQIAGRKDQWIGRLQKHYGLNKEKAEQEVDEFMSGLDDKASGKH